MKPTHREIMLGADPRNGHRIALKLNRHGHLPDQITFPNPPTDREETPEQIHNLEPVGPGTSNSTTYRRLRPTPAENSRPEWMRKVQTYI